MFKLPTCPYCHTVYDYKEVKRNNDKIIQCYHCKKEFRQSKIKGKILIAVVFVLMAFGLNIAIMNLFSNIMYSIIPMFVIDVIIMLIARLLVPYFTEYEHIKKK